MNSCKFIRTGRYTRGLLAALTLACSLALAACGASGDSAASLELDRAASSYETGDSITGDSITIEGEAPGRTTFAQTYARYTATILRQAEAEPAFAEIGEQLSAAEAARDAAVETLLEVTLTRETTGDMANEVTRRAQAGDSPDLFEFTSASTAAPLAAGGYLADLDALGTLKLGNAALDGCLNSALTVAGRCYFLFGDATVGDRAATAAMLVNVSAADAAGIDLDQLTALVRAGEWTAEALIRTAAEGTLSLDGDAVLPLFLSAGGKLFVKDGQDVPTLTPGESFSRAYAAMQTVMAAADGDAEAAVFTVGTLDDLTEGLLALPLPTVDEGESYRSSVDPARAACVSAPASPVDPARTGDILTAYFEQSTDTVSAVLDDYLAVFELSAGGDAALIELILAARDCSLGALFGWGDLPDALAESVGLSEAEFLTAAEMRLTAAAKAMEIFLNRLG